MNIDNYKLEIVDRINRFVLRSDGFHYAIIDFNIENDKLYVSKWAGLNGYNFNTTEDSSIIMEVR